MYVVEQEIEKCTLKSSLLISTVYVCVRTRMSCLARVMTDACAHTQLHAVLFRLHSYIPMTDTYVHTYTHVHHIYSENATQIRLPHANALGN